MPDSFPILIVGGGPAGAIAAANLARAGREVLLFDEKLAWEKPCGGGLTHKALAEWPFLSDIQVEHNWVRHCELGSPSGERVSFHLRHPIAIFSRRVLNGLLLDRALQSGAQIIRDRVIAIERQPHGWQIQTTQRSYDASYLVIAAGARNAFRKQFSQSFAPEDLMVTAGYYIPGHSQTMQIQFLHGLHGYIWSFPRSNHFSIGICGLMVHQNTGELRRRLEEFLSSSGLDYRHATFYSHVLPSLRASTLKYASVSGPGWAMIGDAAGLVDPITGEGLYYAMHSAELLSQALLADQPELYAGLLRQHVLPELEIAAQMADRFYGGRWMGETVIKRTIQFTANSASFRELMCDLFAGTQGYRDLRRRLYLTLPTMLAESLASALRLPSNLVADDARPRPSRSHSSEFEAQSRAS